MTRAESHPSGVALVGTGTVGAAWAAVFLAAGCEVTAYDADRDRAKAALPVITAGLSVLADTGRASGYSTSEQLGRLRWCRSIRESVAGVSYVQESVPEDVELKRAVFGELDHCMPATAVVGSSTSALPMTELAAGLAHPERFIVAHPMNPPYLLPLVEVVPGLDTAAWCVDRTLGVQRAVGQRPVLVRRELPGFVVNRLQVALFREALSLARDGVASAADIDACVTEALALRWAFLGPLGLEEVQGPGVEHVLEHFADYFATLFVEIGGARGPLDARDREVMVEASRAALGERTHDELVRHRDDMVLALRRLKHGTVGALSATPEA